MSRTLALTRAQIKVRMLRALSGHSQEEFERETQVDNIAGMENGLRPPSASQIARMCSSVDLAPEDIETVLQSYEACVVRNRGEADPPAPLRRAELERADSMTAILDDFEARIQANEKERPARLAADLAVERERARASWERVKGLGFDEIVLVARSAREYQTWALVELICNESVRMVSSSAERARDLAGLAVEIAGRVRLSPGWHRRILGFAKAHLASAQNAAGDGDTARETMEEAERLWDSGEDESRILDADRFFDLEASISLLGAM
jgi:hypothetical protein